MPEPVCSLHERDAGAGLAPQGREIRTIVVDDSLRALCATCSMVARQRNLSLLGAANNGREALTLVRSVRPDLVLLDLQMPVSIRAASRLGRECPASRVVVVTDRDTPGLRQLCLQRGARGFIAKDALMDELPRLLLTLFGKSE